MERATDRRGRPIRGLWRHGDVFYAQLREPGRASPAKVRLCGPDGKPVAGLAEAQAARAALLAARDAGELHAATRAPRLADYLPGYVRWLESVRMKRPATIYKERLALDGWAEHSGALRLHQLTPPVANDYLAGRRAGGASLRTCNLDVLALRNLLRHAAREGTIRRNPLADWEWFRSTPPRRPMFAPEQVDAVCSDLFSRRNGAEAADLFRLLALSGARVGEALRLRWADVAWDRRQLLIGADGLAKNHEARAVDFSPQLEAHLRAMEKARRAGGEWMFESAQRGRAGLRAQTFRHTLAATQAATGIRMGWHDCRHYFVSRAVMSGVDFMTIARWVGHKDGGVLIGRVYGHLSDEHARAQAAKLIL